MQPTGLTSLSQEMNADITQMLGETIRLACLQYGGERTLRSTDLKAPHILETAALIIERIPNPDQIGGFFDPIIFPGCTKGRDAVRLHIGKAYDMTVNQLPVLPNNGYHAWPAMD